VKLIERAYPVNPVLRQPKSRITAGISVPAMRFWSWSRPGSRLKSWWT